LIDREEIVTIANLAALGLSEEEIGLYTSRLSRILEFFEKLSTLDDKGDRRDADHGVHPLRIEGPFRRDRAESSLSPDALLGNTEFATNGFFVVRKVIE